MTAGLVTMQLFDEAAVSKLNALTDYTRNQIEEAIRVADIPACVSGGGSMLRVHMKTEAPINYRAAFETPEQAARLKVLLDHLFDNGIMLINTCSIALSTVMTDNEIDILAEVMLGGFRKLKQLEQKD
jgi:glutamate-1-semialdehyde 2,1-aminomutase